MNEILIRACIRSGTTPIYAVVDQLNEELIGLARLTQLTGADFAQIKDWAADVGSPPPEMQARLRLTHLMLLYLQEARGLDEGRRWFEESIDDLRQFKPADLTSRSSLRRRIAWLVDSFPPPGAGEWRHA